MGKGIGRRMETKYGDGDGDGDGDGGGDGDGETWSY